MTTELKIYTLGKLRIQRDGETVEGFITTKAVLLFVYLAMHRGEHTRKKLASLLWSETTDQQALKNLRTVLSSLRQQLDEYLVVSQDALSINSAMPVSIDAVQFESKCTRLFSSPGALDVLREMRETAALYEGPFLEGVTIRDAVSLDQWVIDKQGHLYQLYMRLLLEITTSAEKQKDYETALGYARQLVNLDPLWDAPQRQLMRLLAYTNRTNEALMHYERFSKLLETEIQTEPDAETKALYERIRTRSLTPTTAARKASISLPDMPFVEPVEDVQIAQRMLSAAQCHLLTIFGISGIGKTALVTQLAYHRQHLYRDGAYFISLKRDQSARDLPFFIAGTLSIDVPNHADRWTLENIVIESLKERELLLVLDNYEHLMPETDFVQRILEETKSVKLVITAQSPLNVFREWLLPLKGLSIPDEHDPEAEHAEAVRLFALTAQRVNPRFDLRDNLSGVVKICKLVDGLPLALVIAAGWTQIIPVSKIIEFILAGQEFTLPAQQTLPPRHQSLELMLEYTWNTLSPAEQTALTALSIFNSVFDLDEAQEVCGVDVEVLAMLIQKSLVQRYDDNYRMHHFIWRYARKKLLLSDQRRSLGLRHMVYYTDVLSQLQTEKTLLHEYIVSIEMRYSSIWNYDWLPRSFQPLYLLAVARYLITYWEVSRTDTIQSIRQIFEGFSHENLQPDTRTLLHVILARLYVQDKRYEQAYNHLTLALRTHVIDLKWSDQAAIYQLFTPILYLRKTETSEFQAMQQQFSPDEAYAQGAMLIARRANLRLASLFLDLRDYESAEGLYTFLLDSTEQVIDYALIQAVRGAISAEQQHYEKALEYFTSALKQMEEVDQPLLKLSIMIALLRITYHLQYTDMLYAHFRDVLAFAAEINAVDALRHLLFFFQTQILSTWVNPSHDALQASIERALATLNGGAPVITYTALSSIVNEVSRHL